MNYYKEIKNKLINSEIIDIIQAIKLLSKNMN